MIQNITIDKEHEIRKCPFCGTEPTLYAQKEGWLQSYAITYVHCHTCKARGPRFEASLMNDELKDKAVDAWNERSNG